MALKVDIPKAYVRIEWCFLEAIMKKIDFEEKWIRLVIRCVNSIS